MPPETPEILTAREVSQILRIGLTTVYDAYRQGELRGFRAGQGQGGIRIFAQSVNEFIERKMNRPAPTPEPAIEVLVKKPRRSRVGLKDLVLRPPAGIGAVPV
jgi:excisionase family DNA binding protein